MKQKHTTHAAEIELRKQQSYQTGQNGRGQLRTNGGQGIERRAMTRRDGGETDVRSYPGWTNFIKVGMGSYGWYAAFDVI
jgi:hypothetical protein